MLHTWALFRLEMVQHPPTIVETLLTFSSAVRLIGNTEASLQGVRVTCWLEEETVWWPGVSEAAFDAGGYPPLFVPVQLEF